MSDIDASGQWFEMTEFIMSIWYLPARARGATVKSSSTLLNSEILVGRDQGPR